MRNTVVAVTLVCRIRDEFDSISALLCFGLILTSNARQCLFSIYTKYSLEDCHKECICLAGGAGASSAIAVTFSFHGKW